MMKRRTLCRLAALSAGAITLTLGARSWASQGGASVSGHSLTEVARLEWLCNAVALTSTGTMFVGLPRWPGFEKTPSIAQVMPDGSLKPFPGGEWNRWAPGKPPEQALVKVNTIHIFDDDTLWAIDQGEDAGPQGINRGQKILQFDTRSGKLLRAIVLPEAVLPAGANLNDLRLDSEHAYLTDSGLGAIIVVNLHSGVAIRRLANHPSTRMDPQRRPIGEGGRPLTKPNGSENQVHSDPIELSPDGRWLYYQPLTGPLWRVPTQALRDTQVTEKALAAQVEFVHDTGPLTGTAMDSSGNLFLGEYDKPRVTVLAPDGIMRVLVEDPRLWNPDAMIISNQRELYIPVPQSARLASNRGPGGTSALLCPYTLLKLQRPPGGGGRETVPVLAGDALTGANP